MRRLILLIVLAIVSVGFGYGQNNRLDRLILPTWMIPFMERSDIKNILSEVEMRTIGRSLRNPSEIDWYVDEYGYYHRFIFGGWGDSSLYSYEILIMNSRDTNINTIVRYFTSYFGWEPDRNSIGNYTWVFERNNMPEYYIVLTINSGDVMYDIRINYDFHRN